MPAIVFGRVYAVTRVPGLNSAAMDPSPYVQMLDRQIAGKSPHRPHDQCEFPDAVLISAINDHMSRLIISFANRESKSVSEM